MFEDLKDVEMPKDIKKAFLKNMQKVIFNVQDKMNKEDEQEAIDFVNGFFEKHGDDIYNYHRETFTDEELWKSVIVSKSPEFQKMIRFQIDCQKYVGKLVNDYMENEIYQRCNEEDGWST